MTISLIHPSRGRANKAMATLKKWWAGYTHGVDFEHILSIDEDDPQKNDYLRKFPISHNVIIGPNKSVVEATNAAAKIATGDIFIYLSDDFMCPYEWLSLVQKEFEGVTEPMLLKVDDCLQRFDAPVLTIPIMNRALYDKLGYFWYPEYKSMFCDTDLFEVCKKNGWIKNAPHLKFPHEHVSVGKADNDETYRRSAANWEQGKALFAKRKAAGFPL